MFIEYFDARHQAFGELEEALLQGVHWLVLSPLRPSDVPLPAFRGNRQIPWQTNFICDTFK
jgi:hypothetical protein